MIQSYVNTFLLRERGRLFDAAPPPTFTLLRYVSTAGSPVSLLKSYAPLRVLACPLLHYHPLYYPPKCI